MIICHFALCPAFQCFSVIASLHFCDTFLNRINEPGGSEFKRHLRLSVAFIVMVNLLGSVLLFPPFTVTAVVGGVYFIRFLCFLFPVLIR